LTSWPLLSKPDYAIRTISYKNKTDICQFQSETEVFNKSEPKTIPNQKLLLFWNLN